MAEEMHSERAGAVELKLGDRVKCFAYIKPTKNHYEITTGQWPDTGPISCMFWAGGAEEGVKVEDFHSCDRFRTIEKEFTGVFAGTTTRCTRLNVEYDEPPYGNSGFFTSCDQPKRFAVVYFADNKRRLVPLDKICPAGEWISVKDRLPEPGKDVLLLAHGWEGRLHYIGELKACPPQVGFFGISKPSDWTIWGWSYFREPNVTHWMPLPGLPDSPDMEEVK